MCTCLISNKKHTIVGWNLDILDMEYRVRPTTEGVYIEINDATEGWMPLFGANRRGDFVGMPTCWPTDVRSNPMPNIPNIINLDIDLLLQKKTFDEIKSVCEKSSICSIPNMTFQSQLTNREGDVLQIVPGQGIKFYEKPKYLVMTNFSPFKMNSELHPWMGWDRYLLANKMLDEADDNFNVDDCFQILRAVAQEKCPTVVSMVYDITNQTVYWCEQRQWDRIQRIQF